MKQPLISGLDDGVLERLLDELKRSPTIHDAYAEVVQNLQIHQVELEQQNRELREIQQALELSRDRYAELYERAPVGYATLNRVGTVKQINLPGALLLETERARIVGTSLGRFLQRGQRRALLNHLAQVMDSNESRSLELTLHCDTGPPRVLRLTTDHAHLENGEPVCHVVILNVTEERRAKDALHESVRLIERAHMEWREAFDAIHDPIFLHDAQGRIVRANQAYAAAGGADVKTLPGRRYWEVFPKSDRPMPGCSAAVSGRHDTSESNAEIELDDGRTFS